MQTTGQTFAAGYSNGRLLTFSTDFTHAVCSKYPRVTPSKVVIAPPGVRRGWQLFVLPATRARLGSAVWIGSPFLLAADSFGFPFAAQVLVRLFPAGEFPGFPSGAGVRAVKTDSDSLQVDVGGPRRAFVFIFGLAPPLKPPLKPFSPLNTLFYFFFIKIR